MFDKIQAESGGTTPWEFDTASIGADNTQEISSEQTYSGTNSYKFSFGGTEIGYLDKYLDDDLNICYAKFKVYIDSATAFQSKAYNYIFGLNSNSWQTLGGIGVRADSNYDPYAWYVRTYTGGYTDAITSTTNFLMDEWHTIELYWNGSGEGTANGIFQVWVDGTLIADYSNIDVSSYSTIDRFRLGNVLWGVFESGSILYFDDIEGGDAYTTAEIGDYSSLSDAIAGESDFTVVDANIVFRYTEAFEDTTAVTIASGSFSTLENHRLIIEVPEEYSHDGTRGSGARLIINTNYDSALRLEIPYVSVIGLELKGHVNGCVSANYNGHYVIVDSCLMYDCYAAFSTYGNYNIFCNNITYNITNNAVTFQDYRNSSYCYNNTILNSGNSGIRVGINNFNINIINNYVANSNTVDYNFESAVSLTTCFSSDGSENTSVISPVDCDFESYTAGSEDVTIGSDSDLIGEGTDLSNASVYPFNYDIFGNARTGSWDIGAIEWQ
ncbi:MAG: hypothetical protein JW864_18365 [Spirochaetes bacterium]|nr:hypothetical protein [Spirochaetota bacterium]